MCHNILTRQPYLCCMATPLPHSEILALNSMENYTLCAQPPLVFLSEPRKERSARTASSL